MAIRVIDYTSENAPAEFTAGLREIGFAVLKNHPISVSLIDRTYKQWYEFFKSENRDKFAFDPATHDGYASTELSETAKGYDVKDLKEFYHFYLHGRCPENCREVTAALATEMSDMASTLLMWVEDNSPADVKEKFSMSLPEMIKDSKHTLLRLIHYPPLTGNEPTGAVRAAEHGDINMLTLLPAATAAGLQVKDQEGNWLEVPINPGWIVVNIGDMLAECSGHYYPSTLHRVVNPTGDAAKEPRLSMPLFLHAKDEVVISNRYTAKSFRAERFAELGLD